MFDTIQLIFFFSRKFLFMPRYMYILTLFINLTHLLCSDAKSTVNGRLDKKGMDDIIPEYISFCNMDDIAHLTCVNRYWYHLVTPLLPSLSKHCGYYNSSLSNVAKVNLPSSVAYVTSLSARLRFNFDLRHLSSTAVKLLPFYSPYIRSLRLGRSHFYKGLTMLPWTHLQLYITPDNAYNDEAYWLITLPTVQSLTLCSYGYFQHILEKWITHPTLIKCLTNLIICGRILRPCQTCKKLTWGIVCRDNLSCNVHLNVSMRRYSPTYCSEVTAFLSNSNSSNNNSNSDSNSGRDHQCYSCTFPSPNKYKLWDVSSDPYFD